MVKQHVQIAVPSIFIHVSIFQYPTQEKNNQEQPRTTKNNQLESCLRLCRPRRLLHIFQGRSFYKFEKKMIKSNKQNQKKSETADSLTVLETWHPLLHRLGPFLDNGLSRSQLVACLHLVAKSGHFCGQKCHLCQMTLLLNLLNYPLVN